MALRKEEIPSEWLQERESGWSVFWRNCSEDHDSRASMIVMVSLISVAFIFGTVVSSMVILTSFDDVEQAKQAVALEQIKEQAIAGYISKGVHPALARCMVADGNESITLECYKIIGCIQADGLAKLPPVVSTPPVEEKKE